MSQILFPGIGRPGKRKKGIMTDSQKLTSQGMTNPGPHSRKNSKFFFDMLLAMDRDVMTEYVMPHLDCFTNSNLEWTAKLLEHGEGGGLFSRSLASDFLMPCSDRSEKTVIKTSQYVNEMARGSLQLVQSSEDFAQTVVDMQTKAGITLGIDLVQCRGCACPCKWIVEPGAFCSNSGACETRQKNMLRLDCAQYATAVMIMLRKCSQPPVVSLLQLEELDIATPVGKYIMTVANNIVEHNQIQHSQLGTCLRSLPLEINFSELLLKCGSSPDDHLLTELVGKCVQQDCHTVRMDGFIMLGDTLTRTRPARASSGTRYSLTEMLFASLTTLEGSPIQSLTITDMGVMSINTDDITALCKSILRMPKLAHLDIGTITNIRYDSLSGIMHGLASFMEMSPGYTQEKLVSLRSITLRFGEDDSRRSQNIETFHNAIGVSTPVQMNTICLAYDNAPSLEHVRIIGVDSPASTLRLVAFLQSVLKNPPSKKWKSLTVCARFMPQKLVDRSHRFRAALDSTVAHNILLMYTYTYLPGHPVAS